VLLEIFLASDFIVFAGVLAKTGGFSTAFYGQFVVIMCKFVVSKWW
jgi:hypothetical protein